MFYSSVALDASQVISYRCIRSYIEIIYNSTTQHAFIYVISNALLKEMAARGLEGWSLSTEHVLSFHFNLGI